MSEGVGVYLTSRVLTTETPAPFLISFFLTIGNDRH